VNSPTPITADAELTPELIELVMKLSPQNKDRLVELLIEAIGPPDTRTDEEIAAVIRRRLDAIDAGESQLMTREESEAAIRANMRTLGVELP
jgi:putative addiction module component (TIGR02574 family)